MTDMETVIALEKRLLMPEVRRDLAELDRLIAEDFQEVGASGDVFGKAEVLEDLPDEHGVVRECTDFTAKMLGKGVVLVTFMALKKTEAEVRRSFRTSLWVKRGHWQMVFHQGTKLS